MPTTSRVSAGLRFSKVRPVRLSTHSPPIKFLKTLVLARAYTPAGCRAMGAIRLPSPANCKPLIVSVRINTAQPEEPLQRAFTQLQQAGGCMLNHFHPLEPFLTHR